LVAKTRFWFNAEQQMPDSSCQFEAIFRQRRNMARDPMTGVGASSPEARCAHRAKTAEGAAIQDGLRLVAGFLSGVRRSDRQGQMRKAACLFAAIALISALIGMWAKFEPVATKSVTAARVEPSTTKTSPFELMSRRSKALPQQYYEDPF
jgi:hypothetical protein